MNFSGIFNVGFMALWFAFAGCVSLEGGAIVEDQNQADDSSTALPFSVDTAGSFEFDVVIDGSFRITADAKDAHDTQFLLVTSDANTASSHGRNSMTLYPYNPYAEFSYSFSLQNEGNTKVEGEITIQSIAAQRAHSPVISDRIIFNSLEGGLKRRCYRRPYLECADIDKST